MTIPTKEERLVVRYKTATGDEITLTRSIVQQFFLPDATEIEAHAFMGFCQFTGLNPFLREVYLTRMGGDDEEGGKGRASVIVAYTAFMKRAELTRQYRGFRAGIIIIPDEGSPPLKGVDVEGVYAPCIALKGEFLR